MNQGTEEPFYERHAELIDRVVPLLVGAVMLVAAAVALSSVSWPTRGDGPVALPNAEVQFDTPQILVFETTGCGWCGKFRKEIAPHFKQSDASINLPLAYIDLDQAVPKAYHLKGAVTSTPTFVVVDRRGNEIDRHVGYPGSSANFEKITGRIAKRAPKS
jgi:hypothetical protein